MRNVIIIIILSLISYTPAFARHAHRIHIRVHHHKEVHHDVAVKNGSHDNSHNSLLKTNPTLAQPVSTDQVDPEALAWGPLKESVPVERPKKMVGKLVVKGEEFAFVSGGAGWSIPWGHWAITPDDVGRWGARHGAIGLNHGDDIPDPKLHRGREGVEIHAANHDATAGCVGIREHFADLKKIIIGMIEQFGHAFLHITPHAVAITPTKYLNPTVTVGRVVAASDDDEPVIRKRRTVSLRQHRNQDRLDRRRPYREEVEQARAVHGHPRG